MLNTYIEEIQEFESKTDLHKHYETELETIKQIEQLEDIGSTIIPYPEMEDKFISTNDIEKTVKVNTSKGLNVRDNIGTDSRILATLSNNTIINIVEEKDGWGKFVGWINLKYTKNL